MLEKECTFEEAEEAIEDEFGEEEKFIIYDKSRKGFCVRQRKYSDDQLADILKDTLSPVFVAEDGDVLGYAFCVIQETSTPNLQKEKSLYIDDICVDEAARRGGVGSALWDYVNRFAAENGCRRITLNVWCLNPGAMEFYKKMGMEPLKITMEKLI